MVSLQVNPKNKIKMKVAILTCARTNNYGATLQCYALNKYIQDLGHETIILNVPLDDGSVRPKTRKNIFIRGFRFGYYILKRLFRTNSQKKLEDYEIRYPLSAEAREKEQKYSDLNMKLFDEFRNKYLPNITEEYFTFEDFENNYPEADAYVVGSDQVWNTQITGWQYPIFFLSFVKDGQKRISYAACMGGNSEVMFKGKTKTNIQNLLNKFDSIAVRNEMAMNIFRNNFTNHPVQVLDPTFLIDNYNELLAERKQNAAGCIYVDKFIINEPWMNAVREIASRQKLNIRMDNCLIEIKDVPFSPLCTVQDWLGLINTADIIFTDSFHCSVFCILFHKQFVVAPSYQGGEGRMIDLLAKFGFENRFYRSPNELINNMDKWLKPIDYSEVDKKIATLKSESRDFLKHALIN